MPRQLDSSSIVDGLGSDNEWTYTCTGIYSHVQHISQSLLCIRQSMLLADVFPVGGCTWTKTTPRSIAPTGSGRDARRKKNQARHSYRTKVSVRGCCCPVVCLIKTRRGSVDTGGCMDKAAAARLSRHSLRTAAVLHNKLKALDYLLHISSHPFRHPINRFRSSLYEPWTLGKPFNNSTRLHTRSILYPTLAGTACLR